jgi:hypothetical protein
MSALAILRQLYARIYSADNDGSRDSTQELIERLAVSTITIDPRDFITPPFWPCPNCGRQAYGVLMIRGCAYRRRCRECWHSEEYRLPPIKKKIIYLDQFVVSNIMKLRTPALKAHDAVASEPFWAELATMLEKLRCLQLICCPDSREHQNESLTSRFYQDLKKTYESFSGGISFHGCDEIRQQQIAHLARAWANGNEPVFDFNPQEIVYGDLHGWNDRIYVVTNLNYGQWVDDLRKQRESAHTGITDIFNRVWKAETHNFDFWYEAERSDYQKKHVLQRCVNDERARTEMMLGLKPLTLEAMIPSEAEVTIQAVEHALVQECGAESSERLESFFRENRIKDAPFNIIASAMYASIAMKAASGQKKPPDQGMMTDIAIVSTLLPYCDAMFMDSRCRAILVDVPQSHQQFDSTKVYSPKRKGDFLNYLKEIEAAATPEHLALVAEIYGGISKS